MRQCGRSPPRRKLNLSPDPAFAARNLLRAAGTGTLATQSGGQPYASLVTPAVAPDGSVLMLLSALATHTAHLKADPRCAILVTGHATGANPQTTPRLTIQGRAVLEPDAALKASWLRRHPYAGLYAGFADFHLWRLAPDAATLIAGFASATALPAEALRPDPRATAEIAEAAARIIAHCNADHAEALAELAAVQGAEGPWLMHSVDPDGFDLMQDETTLRIAFPEPARTPGDIRASLVRLVHDARVKQ